MRIFIAAIVGLAMLSTIGALSNCATAQDVGKCMAKAALECTIPLVSSERDSATLPASERDRYEAAIKALMAERDNLKDGN